MCGITGLYNFNRAADEADYGRVQKAVAAIAHRGPDHREVRAIGQSCFGHARLSIIDPSDQGNQPMTDDNKRFWLAYNGELYNYKELRHSLESKGMNFRTECDTEVVLKAFIHYGKECLNHFNGFFAFAIYDRAEHRFFAARDRMGIKPFYYQINENGILFGSELSAVSAMVENLSLNHKALHLYFQLTYVPAPHTMLNGIEKLPPGHMIELLPGSKKVERWFDLRAVEPISPTFEKAAQLVKKEVERSVNLRMVADVPLGTFLSGGIDSSIVSAIAERNHEKLSTFSLGFSDSEYLDESGSAEKVAKAIGSNHHRIMVNRQDLTDHLNPMLETMDEPFADSSALAVYVLSKHTSKEVKVVLSGDGADELFGGYRKHMALVRSEQQSLSNWLLKLAAPAFSEESGSRSNKMGDWSRKLSKYSKGLKSPLDERYWNWMEWTTAENVSAILQSPQRDYSFEQQVRDSIDSENLNSILFTDQETLLPNDMLTKADRMSMAHGLEVRTPFLDHELVRIVNGLPFGYKCSSTKGKLLLREAFAKDLPEHVFDQPKKGFEIPIEQWLRNELREELKNLAEKQLIERQAVFNHKMLAQVLDDYLLRDQNKWTAFLWSFFVFQRWWLKNIDARIN